MSKTLYQYLALDCLNEEFKIIFECDLGLWELQSLQNLDPVAFHEMIRAAECIDEYQTYLEYVIAPCIPSNYDDGIKNLQIAKNREINHSEAIQVNNAITLLDSLGNKGLIAGYTVQVNKDGDLPATEDIIECCCAYQSCEDCPAVDEDGLCEDLSTYHNMECPENPNI